MLHHCCSSNGFVFAVQVIRILVFATTTRRNVRISCSLGVDGRKRVNKTIVMSSTYARRRVATRLTRSTSSKSKDSQDGNKTITTPSRRSKSPSKSASPPSKSSAQDDDDDIPVPQAPAGQQEQEGACVSRIYSISSSASGQDIFFGSQEASTGFISSNPLASGTTGGNFMSDPMSPSVQSFAGMYTPSRSAFSSSVSSSKRKASGEIDPSSLRRSVRQRAEASPFRLDSTEAQRDSTLFISQPQTPTRLRQSPIHRKDSLFMSLPASFGSHGDGDAAAATDAQYFPIFDISLLSAKSNASCFLPLDSQAQPSTTPAQEPPLTAFTDLGPGFDLLQYNDFISPFPSTPQPAFLNFPPTPTRVSGTFAIAPQCTLGTPSSPSFPIPLQAANLQKVAYSPVLASQYAKDATPNTPSNAIRPLPRRARRSSAASSDAGSIIIKDLDDNVEEEDEHEDDGQEGDATAQPVAHHNRTEQQGAADDERFASFASQVCRQTEGMSLKSSQGPGTTSSPAPGAFYRHNDATSGALQFPWPASDSSPNRPDYSDRHAAFENTLEALGKNGTEQGAGASLGTKHDQISEFVS